MHILQRFRNTQLIEDETQLKAELTDIIHILNQKLQALNDKRLRKIQMSNDRRTQVSINRNLQELKNIRLQTLTDRRIRRLQSLNDKKIKNWCLSRLGND
jgi:hypothetical protein